MAASSRGCTVLAGDFPSVTLMVKRWTTTTTISIPLADMREWLAWLLYNKIHLPSPLPSQSRKFNQLSFWWWTSNSAGRPFTAVLVSLDPDKTAGMLQSNESDIISSLGSDDILAQSYYHLGPSGERKKEKERELLFIVRRLRKGQTTLL